MVYTCAKSKRGRVLHVLGVLRVSCVLSVLRVLRVSRVLRVLPETGGGQKLVVWSWSDACIIT
jgi:hypothetical protein